MASASDEAYATAGAEIADAAGAFGCDLVLKVCSPLDGELQLMKTGAALVGMLNPFDHDGLHRLAGAGLTSFALEAAPRTTRAQSMDVLSSQANIAGCKAVITAADRYPHFFPMLTPVQRPVSRSMKRILSVSIGVGEASRCSVRAAPGERSSTRKRMTHAGVGLFFSALSALPRGCLIGTLRAALRDVR